MQFLKEKYNSDENYIRHYAETAFNLLECRGLFMFGDGILLGQQKTGKETIECEIDGKKHYFLMCSGGTKIPQFVLIDENQKLVYVKTTDDNALDILHQLLRNGWTQAPFDMKQFV